MRRLSTLATALVLPGLCGCALFGSAEEGPARVQEFVGAVERVYVEAELARERSRDAVAALRTIAAGNFGGDVVTAYAGLGQELGRSEDQTAALGHAVDDMKDRAAPMFESWSEDVERIANPQLKDRSQQRLAAARDRYESIVGAIEPALQTCQQLNQDLRDHALFLRHDLTPAALADVRAGVEQAALSFTRIERGVEVALGAARNYLEVWSPAVGAPAAPAGESAPQAQAAAERERPPVRLDGSRTGGR